MLGLGLSITDRRPLGTEPTINLSALTGTFTLSEEAAAGAVAGMISGKKSGSTLSLVDNAGGRVALDGTTIKRGATALDYETATSHSFTVRETLAGATNSPRDTVLTLTVTDEVEAAPPIPLTSYVPIGDSIWAHEASPPNQWKLANPSINVNNRSKGGEGIAYLDAERPAMLADDDVSHHAAAMGANDLAHMATATFLSGVQSHFAACKSARPGMLCCANSVLPAGETLPGYTGFNAKADTVNAAYRAGVGDWLDVYFPIAEHPYFGPNADGVAAPDDPTKSNDRLHWNGSGGQAYPIMRQVHDAVMNPIRDGATGTTPSAFTFDNQTNVEPSAVCTGIIIVSGLGPGQKATVSKVGGSGTLRRGRGSFGTSDLEVMNGDAVSVQLSASPYLEGTVSQTISINGVTGTFSVTTKAAGDPIDVEAVNEIHALDFTTPDPHTFSAEFPAGRPAMFMWKNTTPAGVTVNGNAMTAVAVVGQFYILAAAKGVTLPAGVYPVSVGGSPYNHKTEFATGALLNADDADFGTVSKLADTYLTNDPHSGDVAIALETGGMRLMFGRAQLGIADLFDNELVVLLSDPINGGAGYFVAKSYASNTPTVQQFGFGYQMILAVGLNP